MLRDAKLSVDDIDGVVLVGGATRMPHVRKAVADYFQTLPLANIDPDKVVYTPEGRPTHLVSDPTPIQELI